MESTQSPNDNSSSPEPIAEQTSVVVGIGASAGGLEALQKLLQHLPETTNACFIIVQHLSPDYKSMMAELLSKQTNMDVIEIKDGDTIKPNTIFLLPAKKEVSVEDGHLLLMDKATKVVNYTIDHFFQSLARDQRDKAIGIVLSGTGSDGSAGLKALKELGALAIVQKPESAKFDGMPNSAINTGIVDLVLTPQEIGNHLERYIKQPLMLKEDKHLSVDNFENQELLQEVFDLVQSETHVDFSKYKLSTIMRRLQRRMKIRYTHSLSAYLSLLFKDEAEIDLLCKEFLIGVTEFFRDKNAFNLLQNEVIPELVRNAPKDEPLRVWVTACSTGEEAYSIAILLSEELEKQGKNIEIKIFATDINAEAIDKASNGIFDKQVENEVPQKYLSKYFKVLDDGRHQVKQNVRNKIVFASHDLMKDPPFSKVVLVTCRNVLIYIQPQEQYRILSAIYFSLKQNGVLFMGASENLGGLTSKFEVISPKERIFRKVSDERLPLQEGEVTNHSKEYVLTESRIPTVKSLMKSYKRPAVSQTVGFANDALIHELGTPCILLNDDQQALHVYGEVSPYIKQLAPGRISTEISSLINEDIAIALKSAITKAKKSKNVVCFTGLHTKHNGEVYKFDLRVFYVKEHDVVSLPGYFWVMFDAERKHDENSDDVEFFDASKQAKQRIDDLEIELKANKEHLQVTVEELETTNEELQSANEELMSANEELQSTNEELQSVNEELYTVNSEYQEKLAEISQTNEDLDKVLLLSDIGIIYLDSELVIRRYTKATKKYINLMDTDINRPLYHISRNIPYDNMLEDIAEVIRTEQEFEKEIVLPTRNIVRITIYPHKNPELSNKTGAAITFNDVTVAKYAEEGMLVAYRELQDAMRKTALSSVELTADHKLSVLVVDEDAKFLAEIKEQLVSIENMQLSVFTARSIEAAVSIYESKQIDICFSNFHLQKDSAIELIDRFNSLGASLPVVVIAAYNEEHLVPLLLSHGILDMMKKDEISSDLLKENILVSMQRHKLKYTK